jgi:hypothetical protein
MAWILSPTYVHLFDSILFNVGGITVEPPLVEELGLV